MFYFFQYFLGRHIAPWLRISFTCLVLFFISNVYDFYFIFIFFNLQKLESDFLNDFLIGFDWNGILYTVCLSCDLVQNEQQVFFSSHPFGDQEVLKFFCFSFLYSHIFTMIFCKQFFVSIQVLLDKFHGKIVFSSSKAIFWPKFVAISFYKFRPKNCIRM